MNEHKFTADTCIFSRKTIPVFRKFKSLAVLRDTLDKTSYIEWHFSEPAIKLRASCETIVKKNWLRKMDRPSPTGNLDEFHLPLTDWTLIEGDPKWLTEIYAANNWKLKE